MINHIMFFIVTTFTSSFSFPISFPCSSFSAFSCYPSKQNQSAIILLPFSLVIVLLPLVCEFLNCSSQNFSKRFCKLSIAVYCVLHAPFIATLVKIFKESLALRVRVPGIRPRDSGFAGQTRNSWFALRNPGIAQIPA